jgi:hypothetical protein
MEYKGFDIIGDGTFGMKVIKAVGKGSVPMLLRGSYSNDRFAQHAVDVHLSNKEKGNGKRTKGSGI